MTRASIVLLLGLSAFSCTPPPCASTCDGCCGSGGVCNPGSTADACGVSGAACVACGAGKACVAGTCTVQQPAATCTACNTPTDCPTGARCVQYAGSDYCGKDCATDSDCAGDETCLLAVADDGSQAKVCVPKNGTCGASGCGTCETGTTCDPIEGVCENTGAGGGGGTGGGTEGPDAGTCGTYDLPGTASCCHSCVPDGGSDCTANGCYGGWWCDRSACRCHAPTTGNCMMTPPDAGMPPPPSDAGVPMGTVGPTGGTVTSLYFAVVGDTRPSVENDTASYPTAIITKIYQEIQALNPRPQFVVTTGDYMFASPTGAEGAKQMALYMTARNQFSGTVFGAMGNHECTGASATDCTGKTTNNLTAYMNALVTPLGKTNPWYSIHVNGPSNAWTSKFIMTACNWWSPAQKSWFSTELASPTTYTFVVRHMPLGSNGPCNTDMDPLVKSGIDGLLAGHTHTVYFNTTFHELVEGVGGAPITGTGNYGFATVEKNAGPGFTVHQYDYQTAAVVGTYTLP